MSHPNSTVFFEPEEDLPPLFEAQKKIYPKSVKGKYRSIKSIISWLGVVFYFLCPLVRWDRGFGVPHQAILIDLSSRRLYFFGLTFWPQEGYLITGVMVLFALILVFVTTLYGRVWCGFSCPQTVWTEIFVSIERFIEGDRLDRIRLDHHPWTREKIVKKTIKIILWISVSLLTGFSLVSWYLDVFDLFHNLIKGSLPLAAGITMLITAGITYAMGAVSREQFCIYMCPWPRIQSAMVDKYAKIVTYEAWRGEPRGKVADSQAGDCIDCNACVVVCPTGTDIREGDQLSCIGCGLCIDACNHIMDRLNRPRGLITWDSAVDLDQRAQGIKNPQSITFRPRNLIYLAMISAVIGIMILSVVFRHQVTMTILHDRLPLFIKNSDNHIKNGFTIKISSRSLTDQHFQLSVAGVSDYNLEIAGEVHKVPAKSLQLDAKHDDQSSYHVMLTLPYDEKAFERRPITFILESDNSQVIQQQDFFFGQGKAKSP
jgi:cytochrome c oxidase accessory protein FixG